MSSKMKYYQKWNVTKTDMSLKLKRHQIWNVTKTEVSTKLNCHQNWSVIQTKVLLKLKCYHTLYLSSKLKIKFQRSALNTLVLFLSLTWQDSVGSSLNLESLFWHSAACCTHCTIEPDLQTWRHSPSRAYVRVKMKAVRAAAVPSTDPIHLMACQVMVGVRLAQKLQICVSTSKA